MIKPTFFNGTIEFNKIISNETHQIRIKPNVDFNFEPGQFVTITVAPQIKRSYSVASIPGLGYFDLIGDTRAGGPGSHFFDTAKDNQEVEVLGPLGMFTLKETENPVIFWATGTGVVPFMSMIEAELLKNPDREMILNSGFRFEEDIFAKELFTDLSERYPNFKYNLYLSKPTDSWIGKGGRITEYLNELDKPEKYDHYMCGVKAMVDELIVTLSDKKVPVDQVHYEKF